MITSPNTQATTPRSSQKEGWFPPAAITKEVNPKRLARIAGFLYLLVAALGGFSELYVRSSVVVPGDAVATTGNIAASAGLFRLGLATDLLSITLFLLVAFALYALFESTNRKLASAMVILNAMSVAILSINMVNHGAAYLIATGVDYSSAAGVETSAAQVMLFLDLHSQGYLIAEIFFGLWLLPLGYLVFKSGFFPKALGVLLMVGSASYLADVLMVLAFPNSGPDLSLIVATPAAIAEVAFLAWLLVKSVNVRNQSEHVPIAV